MTALIQPTTTIRRYSLVVEADDRERQATEEWRRAGEAYSEDKSTTNAVRLIRASYALEDARKDYRSVVKSTFLYEREMQA
jgi:hypothetical protein